MEAAQETTVAQITLDKLGKDCIAQVVANGDVVNFRFLFLPASPLRSDSSEELTQEKYAYLLPGDEQDETFRRALALVEREDVLQHIERQLALKGPAQLPAPLLVPLADNALRLGHYSAAAQAYELLRIRRRMQALVLEQADHTLSENNIKSAVKGYYIASRLAYDYGAFPEPLPAVPDYQNLALLLHGEYPKRPEDAPCLQAPDQHVRTALHFLLQEGTIAERLESHPLEVQLEILKELVQQLDPGWHSFLEAYHQSHAKLKELGAQWAQLSDPNDGARDDEYALKEEGMQPEEIMSTLLGRTIENGEWWQYLKELAYEHPAAPLFLTRQLVTRDVEIIMPRYYEDSPIVQRLGIAS